MMGTLLKYLFQLILSPGRGWEDVARAVDAGELRPEGMQRGAFAAWLGVCSASALVRLMYGADVLWCAARGIISFAALYLSYQLGVAAMGGFMPRLAAAKVDPRGVRRPTELVAMMAVAFVALAVMVQNVVKVRLAIVDLMPLYAAAILWKGGRLLQVAPRQEGAYMAVASVSVLASWYMINWLFGALLT